nr:3-oxoacyl-[acyl-carrier-protein] synthase III C-terminal domain-containing protein [Nocardia transvalensis]
MYFAGIGAAEVGVVDIAEAVERGWYDAGEAARSKLVSITAAGSTPAPDLAVSAAERAVAAAGLCAEEFAFVFHTNVHPQGPDGWSAQHYINRRTIDQPVPSVEIRNGCIGFLSSLQLAVANLRTTPDRGAALLTCADNFGTPSVDRWTASSLFVLADGGGALVLSNTGGFARLLAIGSLSAPELEERHRSGEPMFPPGLTDGRTLNFEERMADFQRRVTEGLLRPRNDFGSVVIDTVERVLKEADTSLSEITRVVHDGFAYWSLHDLFLDPLGIGLDRGVWEFTRTVGHAGPLDQIRGLEYLWRTGQLAVGDTVLMFTGAPGMEAAAAVIRIESSR